MEVLTVVSVAWSIVSSASSGVGFNELHRRLVEGAQAKHAANANLSLALHECLLESVDALAKVLSDPRHPYFRSIADPTRRRDERTRIGDILARIRSSFPKTGSIYNPLDYYVSDEPPEQDISALVQELGIDAALTELPESLRNSFLANLPGFMLLYFQRRLMSDDTLFRLFMIESTTANAQSLEKELREISVFLRERFASENPADIEQLTGDLSVQIRTHMDQASDLIVEGVAKRLEPQLEELAQQVSDAVTALQHPERIVYLQTGFVALRPRLQVRGAELPYLELGGRRFERLCYLLLVAARSRSPFLWQAGAEAIRHRPPRI